MPEAVVHILHFKPNQRMCFDKAQHGRGVHQQGPPVVSVKCLHRPSCVIGLFYFHPDVGEWHVWCLISGVTAPADEIFLHQLKWKAHGARRSCLMPHSDAAPCEMDCRESYICCILHPYSLPNPPHACSPGESISAEAEHRCCTQQGTATSRWWSCC